MFKAEFVTLVSLKVPSGGQPNISAFIIPRSIAGVRKDGIMTSFPSSSQEMRESRERKEEGSSPLSLSWALRTIVEGRRVRRKRGANEERLFLSLLMMASSFLPSHCLRSAFAIMWLLGEEETLSPPPPPRQK